jgi:leucine dehydrogenase
MSVFSNSEFNAHEQVSFFTDRASGLRAIIAVHNTHLGPALGGCRMFPYASDEAAITDVLRLAEGMTYKAALANLPQGGGKSVIFGNPHTDKSPEMMQAMGRCVEAMGGTYIVAEDSGISVQDVQLMATQTGYAGGHSAHVRYDGQAHDGNPAPATAYGVFVGIQAAVRYRYGSDLAGKHIAIQGVGQVGRRLVEHCLGAGAQVTVADTFAQNVAPFAARPDVNVIDAADIHRIACDVLSPCALGATLNVDTIPEIQASVIAGAANNQLATPTMGELLHARDIVYAPDYVINAGGIIDIHHQQLGSSAPEIEAHLAQIGTTLMTIFKRSEAEHLPTNTLADKLAKEKVAMV